MAMVTVQQYLLPQFQVVRIAARRFTTGTEGAHVPLQKMPRGSLIRLRQAAALRHDEVSHNHASKISE